MGKRKQGGERMERTRGMSKKWREAQTKGRVGRKEKGWNDRKETSDGKTSEMK